jgi:ABC-type multidrug transport system ATPase subunit
MIELQQVSKSYNGKIQAVDHIDLSVERGEIFGFLGPNGAGKTTTIKMITGILEPDTGTIQVNGHDIVRDPIRAKRSFGFVPDDPNIFPRLKAMNTCVSSVKFMKWSRLCVASGSASWPNGSVCPQRSATGSRAFPMACARS